MKKVLLVGILVAALSGCASIVSKSQYAVTIASAPEASNFTIKNKRGQLVHSGVTPSTVTLKASSGYFAGESYDILFSKEGYPDKTFKLSSSIDGWFLGNILFGGVIGLLIVDPASGAMYSLPSRVDVTLDESVSKNIQNELTIASIDTLTDYEKTQLVKIN